MSKIAVVAALAAVAAASNGVPAYQGPLLLQPGNNAAKCLQPTANQDGAAVVVADCVGGDAQKWTFTNTNGNIKIYGNKCLDVKDGKVADGTKLQIWTCGNANANQNWYYTDDNHLAWTNKGKCVDLTDGSLANGNVAQVWGCSNKNPNQIWNVGYLASDPPNKSENGQTGTNKCTDNSNNSMCQTAWINDVDDFCLWAPPSVGTIGDTEREEVAWCTKSGRGTRVMPKGTLKGVHFVKTKDYVQVTGVGDFTKINVPKGDDGGELDPHGADGNGNPIGGLVYGNTFSKNLQYHEWTNFMSDSEFCFRACTGPNAAQNCQHIYDVMGCAWNMPANYNAGTFESCDADNDLPMGVYGTSTWYQGVKPTPAAHPAAKSSNCRTVPSITPAPVKRSHKRRRFHIEDRAMVTGVPAA
ncbi:ricin-type beta-trefoil lectin domain protein [Ceratobasidium sp. AG-Ba]|nr:ricin-type beta-trefoil lectin domain protein [Ceratobasidium sp. AG-Ba]QRW06545.1 ricin-type beta-trefoil lectin domain protein [Ceratobasidium sp. AG-Ba]